MGAGRRYKCPKRETWKGQRRQRKNQRRKDEQGKACKEGKENTMNKLKTDQTGTICVLNACYVLGSTLRTF